jgi:ankyrin repeat protein
MVQWLIKRDKRDINAEDTNGHTPLIWAIIGDWANSPHRALLDGEYQYFLWTPRNGTNIETARFLIENGTRIHPDDHQQRNILHWVARMGTADILSILLECGVDVRADGRTALHLAIMEGAVECVRLLLRAGANPNAIDNAPSGGSSVKLLRQMELDVDNKPCQTPPLHLVFTEPDSGRLQEMTQLLLDAGVNVFGRDFNGKTCLHVAVKEGNMTAVEELLCPNSYDNLYVGIKYNVGRSARDYIEQLGHKKTVKLLEDAEKGKRPNWRYSRITVIPLPKD